MDRPPVSPKREQSPQQAAPAISGVHPRPMPASHQTSSPPMQAVSPYRPLLPPGWTEHRAPNGMFYYYSASTGQSTWERPAFGPPPPPPLMAGIGGLLPGVLPSPFQPLMTGSVPHHPVHPTHGQQLHQHYQHQHHQLQLQQLLLQQKDRKKEHKKKEKSKGKKPIPGTTWFIVTTTEGNEFYYDSETKQSVWEVPEEIKEPFRQLKERERQEEAERLKENAGAGVKRKADDDGESGADEATKRAKGDEGTAMEGTELTEDDIAFQLQFMEEQERDQLLQEDGHIQSAEGTNGETGENDAAALQGRGGPAQNKEVELTNEERMLMFKSLLRDLDVSPFTVWEKELPRIIHDPRYTLIATLKQRKEIFDDYCKERAIEIRNEKNNKEKTKTAREEYEKLLEEETTHRSHWDDFRRKYKRDPRFKGCSDKEDTEKMFRDHVKRLKDKESERRRAQQKKAEKDFLELLRETREIKRDSSWRKIKRIIDEDPRYLAVESSTERENLFYEYCRQLGREDEVEAARRDQERRQREKKAREEASLRERKAQVRREMEHSNRGRERERGKSLVEGAKIEFRTLLIDMVRTHQVTYETKKADLERDARFHDDVLHDKDRRDIFNEHVDELYAKRLAAYHELLDKHVELDTTWLELAPQVRDESRATRLSRDEAELERLFDKYLERRRDHAEREFREMLRENGFLEYRTRMVKLSEDDAVDETGARKEKAISLTIEEVRDVLKDDKRYAVLDCMPEVRERLIGEHLGSVQAPKMTVHQGRD